MEILGNSDNELFLSEASFYEMGIKARMIESGSRRPSNKDFENVNVITLDEDRKKMNIKLLKSIPSYYTNIPKVGIVNLKDGKIHGDPFDLLIISQAMSEKLPILSSDEYFPSYKSITTIK